jgi:hypothetical protein
MYVRAGQNIQLLIVFFKYKILFMFFSIYDNPDPPLQMSWDCLRLLQYQGTQNMRTKRTAMLYLKALLLVTELVEVEEGFGMRLYGGYIKRSHYIYKQKS